MSKNTPDNQEIAENLERIADLLASQDANPHRVRAYRHAAAIVRELKQPVSDLLDEKGAEALQDLPGIGSGLAGTITEFVKTGRLGLLDRLQGEISPVALFSSIPGIGPELANRIHDELDIETLEELELAAHDGRLANVEGFGQRRLEALRDVLAGILSRSGRRRSRRFNRTIEANPKNEEPPVEILLDVDDEYRRRAEKDELKKIAPRRFNPEGKAWLPIMHTERGDWSFTALFSNTARAHQRKATRDWVVLYYQRNGLEQQCTVVSEEKAELAGKRVVRGRELECRDFYRKEAKHGLLI
ncbi:MAG: helix-hairpin-helix domain-containing protein [Calditrichota bacterium]